MLLTVLCLFGCVSERKTASFPISLTLIDPITETVSGETITFHPDKYDWVWSDAAGMYYEATNSHAVTTSSGAPRVAGLFTDYDMSNLIHYYLVDGAGKTNILNFSNRPKRMPPAIFPAYVDTKFSSDPYGDYDAPIIKSIARNWYKIMDEAKGPLSRGIVKMSFDLHSDGTIDNFETVETSLNEKSVQLCREALAKSAPFPAWSEEMLKSIGKDSRKIFFRFSFQ